MGVLVFWHDANATPTMEWEKWLNLFQVAIMAKNSSSITAMTREVTDQLPRKRSLIGDLYEDPANKKVVSAMHLSFGEAARKQIRDKFSKTHCGH